MGRNVLDSHFHGNDIRDYGKDIEKKGTGDFFITKKQPVPYNYFIPANSFCTSEKRRE